MSDTLEQRIREALVKVLRKGEPWGRNTADDDVAAEIVRISAKRAAPRIARALEAVKRLEYYAGQGQQQVDAFVAALSEDK